MKIEVPRSGFYLVSRTSLYTDEVAPCDEAFKVLTARIDRRSVDDPAKLPSLYATHDWLARGKNHRIENGMICRDLEPIEEWAVEIAELGAFIDVHGPCVIGRNGDGFLTIEIYDNYRE